MALPPPLPPSPEPPLTGSSRAARPPSAKAPPESVLAAPRHPVTRWNRRYLAAGAGLGAAGLAVALWFGLRAPTRARPPDPAADTDPALVVPTVPDRFVRGYADPALQALARSGPAVGPALPPPEASTVAAAPPPGPEDPLRRQARQQAVAARAASPFFQTLADGAPATPAAAPAAEPSALTTAPSAAPPFAVSPPGVSPVGVSLVGGGSAGVIPSGGRPTDAVAADVQPANGQAGKRQFAAGSRFDDVLPAPLREPQSPWEVKAGAVIAAALLTAVNSDLPGEIIAQVTEPVYDHVTGRTVLIPQGARLIGRYDSQVAYGQARVLIAWGRIVMPNGRSINLGAMEGADLSGASGLHDRVDGHVWRLVQGAALSTALSVGAASAQDAAARGAGGLVLNSAGSGVAGAAQQIGGQITARDLGRQPTLTIRAGWPLRVLVSQDIVLAPYP